MRSVRLWGLRDPEGEMHIVETMAHAYAGKIEHPDWDAFVLRIADSGIYEIEDGPVTIIGRRGKLYGDRTHPVQFFLLRAIMAMGIGLACGQYASTGSIAWIVVVIINILGLHALSRAENLAIGRALYIGIRFFKEVQRLIGPDEARAALNMCAKGDSNGSSTQDDGKSAGDR